MNYMKFALIIGATIVTLKAIATADPAASSTPEVLYSEGQTAYNHADYATAISKWRASYDLSGAVELLFNLAQAYRLSGDCMNALLTYEQFVTIDPAAEQRPLADDLTHELEAQCGAPSRPAPPAVVDHRDAKPRQRSGRDLKITGLVTSGVGAVLIATGLGLGHRAQTIAGEVTSACAHSCDWTEEGSKDASGRRDAAIGYAIDAIGVAAIASGAIVYYLGDRQDGIHVSMVDRSHGAILSWSGSW
jgi:tetratricopeptide (TPR) repeat protein